MSVPPSHTSPPTRAMRVMVSSTAMDLALHRQHLERVVLQHGWQPILLMEHESSLGGYTVPECRKLVESCDLFVQIVGRRYGWVPSVAQGGNGMLSITALELVAWINRGRTRPQPPPILFFAKERSGLDSVSSEALAFDRYRNWVKDNLMVHFFDLPASNAPGAGAAMTEFESKVRTQLSHVKDILANARVKAAEQHARDVEAKAKNERLWTVGIASAAVGFGLVSWVTSDDKPPPKKRRR